MMTEEKRIEWLLELQEHPEQLTDEKLQQILADDEMRQLVQQLGFAKRAFKYDDHANELTNAARAEGKLACTMPCKEEEDDSQLDALDERKRLRERLRVGDGTLGMGDGTSGIHKPRFVLHLATHKIAASFIGVLLASGIAFAAIQVVRNISTTKPQLYTTEQTTDIEPVTSLPADTVKADTIPIEPYIFNNAPLDSMLTTIATAHGVDVEFENDAARQLRFHFVWKREDSLTRVVEKLNTFEAVNIGMEDKTLVVR